MPDATSAFVCPPAINTLPSWSRVAVCSMRAVPMGPADAVAEFRANALCAAMVITNAERIVVDFISISPG
jgi:hypothetical protein